MPALPFVAPLVPVVAGPDTFDHSEPSEVGRVTAELEHTTALAAVHAELVVARRGVLASDEFVAETELEQRLRAADRDRRLRLGLRATRDQHRQDRRGLTLHRRQARQELRLARHTGRWQAASARAEGRQRMWEGRALRRRRRFTDPSALLATTLREYRSVASVLLLVITAGIVWTSYGVAHALGGPLPAPLYYGVEGLFSVPLLVIVRMQMTAARHGRLGQLRLLAPATGHGVGRRLTPTAYVELFLLVLTISVNVWPTIRRPFVPELFLVRFFPPVLILIAVVLFGVAATLFSTILAEVYLGEPADGAVSRLSPEDRDAVGLAYRVRHALDADRFAAVDLDPDTGLPSISAVQRLFGVRKATCQRAHDVLALQHRLREQHAPGGDPVGEG